MRTKIIIGVGILAVLIIVSVMITVFFETLVIAGIEHTTHFEVSYTRLAHSSLRQLCFTNLSVVDKKRGIGFTAARAEIRPHLKFSLLRGWSLNFMLHNVRFIAQSADNNALYNEIAGLVSVPFKEHWMYREISGEVRFIKDGLSLKHFNALSDDITFTINGIFYTNNTLSAEITIRFAPKLTTKIPDALSQIVLFDEPNGWKSLAVTLRGDYKTPAMQVSGKLFRLNIKGVE